jgi:hypothetical protein
VIVVALVLGSLFVTQPWPAHAQTDTVPETTAVAPGDTAPDGGPLLVPGEPDTASSVADDTENADDTGTVVALVISGLLVVALLLALLTYWYWRNTRPTNPMSPATESRIGEVNG